MDVLLLGLFVTGLLFFSITSLILLHNRRHFLGLADLTEVHDPHQDQGQKETPPLVSILIPARNEERNLPRLLETLRQQDWPRMEIHILDDHSEDNTRIIAEEFRDRVNAAKELDKTADPGQSAIGMHVYVHSAKRKPDGWLGKNWACHQLAGHARGNLYVFLDADTWVGGDAVSSIVVAMEKFELDFATVWPHQVMDTLLEKSVVSTVYSTVAAYLPTLYSYRAPAWIPFPDLRQKVKPLFASACGQCMIFKKQTYHNTGGHESVKDQVVEDVMLAKKVVRSGKSMRMFHGTNRLWCRMYRNPSEIFNGFRKNFFAGFGYRFLPFLFAWLLHFAVYLLPVLVLAAALSCSSCPSLNPLLAGGFAALVAGALLQRLCIAKFLKWPYSTALLYLPGILWFHMLAFVVIRDHLLQSGPSWKGRPV